MNTNISHWQPTILLILVAILVIINPLPLINAQVPADSSKGMEELLEILNDRTYSEPGFTIHIKFAQPLIEDQDEWWVIPTGDTTSNRNIRIHEIGTDYLCIGDRGGQAYAVRCTPFSNIVQIFWLDN